MASTSKSVDVETCDVTETDLKEDSIENNYSFSEIVKNLPEENFVKPAGISLELNAILQPHTGLKNKGPTRIYVETNEGSGYIQFTEGYIVLQGNDFIWMRFLVRLKNAAFEKVLYNYSLKPLAYYNLANDKKSDYKREYSNDEKWKTKLCRYDGILKFQKNGVNEKLSLENLKAQSMEAIEIYSKALLQKCLPVFGSANSRTQLQETWAIILLSFHDLRLKSGSDIPAKQVKISIEKAMEKALSVWYTIFFSNDYPEIFPSTDRIFFKLAVALILTHVEMNHIQSISLQDCQIFLGWIAESVSKKEETDKLSEFLALNLDDLSQVCESLREACEKMVNHSTPTNYSKVSYFPALLELAYVDRHTKPLRISIQNFCTKDVLFSKERIYKSRVTLKNLLILAVSSNIDLHSEFHELEEFQLDAFDLLKCLTEVYANQNVLSAIIIELLENSLEKTDASLTEDVIEDSMDCLQTLLGSFTINHSNLYIKNASEQNRIIVKRFLHVSLDILALYDAKSTQENYSQITNQFYKIFAEFMAQLHDVAGELIFDDEAVFHWANVLAHRNGLRSSSRAFLDTQAEKFIEKCFNNDHIIESAPKLCWELPTLVEKSRKVGFKIRNFDYLQNILEDLVIRSIPEHIQIYASDDHFLQILQDRLNVVNAFCDALEKQFPVFTDNPSLVITNILTFMNFKYCSITLQLLKRHGPTVRNILAGRLLPFTSCFGEISQRLETADISLEEFGSLESEQRCFKNCLEIICGEEAKTVEKKFDTVKVFRDNLKNTMNEVETFKRLAEKWQNIGIPVNLSVITDARQDWKSRPMKSFEKFRRDCLESNEQATRYSISLYEFYIEMMESHVFSETCYQVFSPLFGSRDISVPYRYMRSNKLRVVHSKYGNIVRTFVQGPLSFAHASAIFHFDTDEEKEKEIEYLLKFFLREKEDENDEDVESLKKLRIKQIRGIQSMKGSWKFIQALNQLVSMVSVNSNQPILASFQKMEALDKCNIYDLEEAVIDLCYEISQIGQKNLTALQQFIDRPNFLRWIKSKIQSPQELAFVIELAHVSSSDLGNDEERVQDFFNAIHGYGPFIYSLHCESTFEDIKEAYERVFENLKQNPKLLEQYVRSALDRPWFERMLETLGSAETKAVDAAISINKSGIYKIKYDKVHNEEEIKILSSQDVVSLDYIQTIKESSDSKRDMNKHLGLNDLKDLYNWLMLIVRKEKPQEAAPVDGFERTIRNIETLASYFVSLYNSGCSFFHGWSVVIRTISSQRSLPAIEVHFGGTHFDPLVSSNDTCDFDLSSLCLSMESIKRKWESYVFDTRKKHSALNFFNGQQLRILCSSLAQSQFTNDTALFYLQTLNANLTFEKVQAVLDDYKEQQCEEERAKTDSIHDSCDSDDSSETVDEASRLIGVLEALKKYRYDETLAKAALFMTGFTTESEALNWIIDNQDENEVAIENHARQFDQHYASLAPTENTKKSDQDEPLFSHLAHNVERRFDSYLSKQNQLQGLINLQQLDFILRGCIGEVVKANEFMPRHMKNGQPNLVVCRSRSDILPQVVSMYRFILIHSLPEYTQILMCSSDTTSEEVEIFVLRALQDRNSKVYSMVFADELEINCVHYLEKLLFEKLNDVARTYKLVVFVRDETSPVSEFLEKFKTKLEAESTACIRQYICANLKTGANKIDIYKSRLITSTQPSSGKSLYISELESKLKQQDSSYKRIIMRLCDKRIDFGKCLDILWHLRLQKKPTMIHLDFSCNIKENVEELVFSLCILGGIQDSRGKLFVNRSNFFICIEMLDPAVQVHFAKNSVLQCLPSCCCLSPNQYIQQKTEIESEEQHRLITNESFIRNENFQRPYQYLTRLENEQDVSSYSFPLSTEVDNQSREVCVEMIKTLINWSGLPNPTWAQLTYFANFLNKQLELCEKNFFTTDSQFKGFKSFLIKQCIVKMAQDFALPSLSPDDQSPSFGINEDFSVLKTHQIRRRWENHAHPYIFFNSDNMTFTFLGVKVENTNLLDSKGNILAKNAMPLNLERLIRNQAYDHPNILGENFDMLTKGAKLTKLQRVLGIEENSQDVDLNYELTQDNVMKLLAIYMRFKCNIPVVIIGETGCGKTRLVEYLCSLLERRPKPEFPNKKIVKIHGGVSAEDIARNVKEAEKHAKENFKQGVFTVLFFDEANTTEAIHVIKEVVCDFTIQGQLLDQNCGLKIVVACNPYRKHNQKMIEKLENAGLGFPLSPNVDHEKLEDGIPMRHLVYRVNPLPPSLLPLAWDFGRLTVENENKYIHQIVTRHGQDLKLQKSDVDFIRDVFCLSQNFLRQDEELGLSVSLRHIDRAMKVLKFFHTKRKFLLPKMNKLQRKQSSVETVDARKHCKPETLSRLVVLTIGVCYYFSLDEHRDTYLSEISKGFTDKYALPDNVASIKHELELCQKTCVDNLELNSKMTIAKNKALVENVFMMFVCIQTNIPLFLVGKPGSSKSLAKTLLSDAMQGKHSPNEFFRHFKQAHVLSYQCSPHTTAEGIVNTFKQATLYQKRKDLSSFTSVVVLDEIGLAEASVKMPLKALHTLLEEGYVEEGNGIRKPSEHSKVAFIGISNWALDPAKMSRGILVSRTTPDHKELAQCARAICRVNHEGSGLEYLIEPLSKAYEEIYKIQISQQTKEFIGLRDFYGLLKMLYCEYVRSNYKELSFVKVCKAICRNFGGRKSSVIEIFIKHCQELYQTSMMKDVLAKVKTLDLVRDNIEEANKRLEMLEEQQRMDNESRYLLLMTENFAALQLLPNVLNVKNCEIIFGSSFPQDREYIDVCRNINKIKMCMECGIPVVLLNIGFVYESLYDVLNQHYVYYGKKRLVDLGLGSNRVKCNVADKFQLIIIEEETVAEKFPIPLMNRLEKHFLGIRSILTPRQREAVSRLTDWMFELSGIPRTDVKGYFKTRDVFIGFVRQETASYIILQVYNSLSPLEKDNPDILLGKAFEKAFQTCTEEAVIQIAKKAPVSNVPETLELCQDFKGLYVEQGRRNLSELLQKQCYSWKDSSKPRFLEITTFCGTPSANEIKQRNRDLMRQENETTESDDRHCVINLNWIKTEQEFAGKVKEFLRQCAKREYDNLTKCLFLTCSKGQKHVHLMACAKYCLENLINRESIPKLCVILIIELPRNWYVSNYSSFCVGQWDCFHVDSLLADEEGEGLRKLLYGERTTLRELFQVGCQGCSQFQKTFLRDIIYETVADSSKANSSKVVRVANVLQLFDGPEIFSGIEELFLNKLASFLYLELGEDVEIGHWVLEKAASLQDLIEKGSLKNVILGELKQKAKPHMANFLKVINFDNNLHLLFEEKWCQDLWINLFSLMDAIAIKGQMSGESMQLVLEFPFSTYVINEMEDLFFEIKKSTPELSISEIENKFLKTVEKDKVCDLWRILRAKIEKTDTQKALEAFINDLIVHELNVTVQKDKRDLLKFIRHVVIQKMRKLKEIEPSVGLAFIVFHKMKSELKFIRPLVRLFTVRICRQNFDCLTNFILTNTIEILMHKVDPKLNRRADVEISALEFNKQELAIFVENVNLVKNCSKGLQNDAEFQQKLEKLTIFCYYVTEISNLLESELIIEACEGAQILWKSMHAMNGEIFSEIFIKRLISVLQTTSDAVLGYCLMKGVGGTDCAFCLNDVVRTSRKKGFPVSLPCQKNHPVHRDCWANKLEEMKSCDDTSDDTVKCLLCQSEVEVSNLKACTSPALKFVDGNLSHSWIQSIQNVKNVFLGLAMGFIIPRNDRNSLHACVEYCIVKKNGIADPYFFDNHTKFVLLFTLVKQAPVTSFQHIETVLRNDWERETKAVDITETMLLLQNVIDLSIFAGFLESLQKCAFDCPRFVTDMLSIAQVKNQLATLSSSISQTLPGLLFGTGKEFEMPTEIEKILLEDGEVAENMKRSFRKSLYMHGGERLLNKPVRNTSLARMFPNSVEPFTRWELPGNVSEIKVRYKMDFWNPLPNLSLQLVQSKLNEANFASSKFPVLASLFDDDLEIIETLKSIPTLLVFFRSLSDLVNDGDLNTGFSNFLAKSKNLPTVQKENLVQSAEKYLHIWNNAVRFKLDLLKPDVTCKFDKELSCSSALKFFFPSRTQTTQCCAWATLFFLISKNNKIILRHRACFNIQTPVLYLDESAVTEGHVVAIDDIETELRVLISTFTSFQNENGPTSAVFDFESIERMFSHKFCAFKQLINPKIMKFTGDESLLKEALSNARSLGKTKPLSRTTIEKISQSFIRMPDVCHMLKQVEILMKYLDTTSTKADDTISLGDFMLKKLRKKFVSGIQNVEISQIVSLWQHLALQKTCLMSEHSDEDPFLGICSDFKCRPLTSKLKKQLDRLEDKKKEELMVQLNEYILVHLNDPGYSINPETSIKQSLDQYYNEDRKCGLQSDAKMKFAEEVMKHLLVTTRRVTIVRSDSSKEKLSGSFRS